MLTASSIEYLALSPVSPAVINAIAQSAVLAARLRTLDVSLLSPSFWTPAAVPSSYSMAYHPFQRLSSFSIGFCSASHFDHGNSHYLLLTSLLQHMPALTHLQVRFEEYAYSTPYDYHYSAQHAKAEKLRDTLLEFAATDMPATVTHMSVFHPFISVRGTLRYLLRQSAHAHASRIQVVNKIAEPFIAVGLTVSSILLACIFRQTENRTQRVSIANNELRIHPLIVLSMPTSQRLSLVSTSGNSVSIC